MYINRENQRNELIDWKWRENLIIVKVKSTD